MIQLNSLVWNIILQTKSLQIYVTYIFMYMTCTVGICLTMSVCVRLPQLPGQIQTLPMTPTLLWLVLTACSQFMAAVLMAIPLPLDSGTRAAPKMTVFAPGNSASCFPSLTNIRQKVFPALKKNLPQVWLLFGWSDCCSRIWKGWVSWVPGNSGRIYIIFVCCFN